MPDQTLDATGLKCPMPVLRARRALKALPSGALLELLADDPASAKDVRPRWRDPDFPHSQSLRRKQHERANPLSDHRNAFGRD
jgi:hypothetical protein